MSATLFALGGAAALGSSIVNALSQKSANNANLQAVRETNQANLELYNKQFSDQLKLWNMNNAYNDPSAQMSRLRAAGLNPTLNMGSNPTGSAEMASAPSAHPMQAGHVEPVQWNFSDVANSIAMMAGAAKSHQEAVGQQIGNQYIAQEKIQNIARQMAETRLAFQNVRKGSAEEAYLKAREKYLMQEYQLFSETFDARKHSFDLQNLLTEAQTDMVKEQARSFGADIAYKDSLRELNIIEKSYRGQQLQRAIDLMMAQAENYKEDTEVKKALKRLTGLQGDEIDRILPLVAPRVRSEIYRNTLAESGVSGFGVSAHGQRSAYDEMFDDRSPQVKQTAYQKKKKDQNKRIQYDYGNGD